MSQALHIFCKDLRYLRLEVALVAVLAVMLAVFESEPGGAWWAEMLFVIAAAHLIARLIHAEAIPGMKQFWITRPYRADSLLSAKLLFVVIFVSLPLCLAQLYIVMHAGFPVSSILRGLLWSHTVTFAAVILPVAALAALTAGIVPFIFVTLVLLAAGFSTQPMVQVLLRTPPAGLSWPVAVEWVREAALATVLALIATCVLYLQYRYHWTKLSRAVAIAGVAAASVAWLYMPWRFALAAQLRLSNQTVDTAAVTVGRETGARLSLGPVPGRGEDNVQIRIPIVIQSDVLALPDAFEVTLTGADGRLWSTASGGVNTTGRGPGKFEAVALVPASFVAQADTHELTARGTIWLTLFEQSFVKTVRLRDGPVDVADGLQCYPGAFNYLWCRSAFRWPRSLIYVKVRENDVRRLTSLISYSPFPGNPGFNPIEARWAPGSIRPDQEITIFARNPVAHVRRDFDIGTFRFSELRAQQQPR